jgi:hypothetical protein
VKPGQPETVMAGLVPAIHAAPSQNAFAIGRSGAAWMPGTRPGMTRVGRHSIFLDLPAPKKCR